MTAQNIRFKYTDSTGTDQIVASTVGDGAEIDHATQYRNFRDVNIAKVWGGRGLFNAFPQQKSQFNTAEPELLLQEEVNGTWTTVGRFYAKGSGDIKDKESVAHKLYGFQRYVESQDISISNTTTNIVDAAEKLPAEIEGNYVVEAPSEGDVSGGYPQVDNYSYNGKAEGFVQDLSRKYKWTLKWTNRTDGSGNNIIRFEPRGYGGAVDTLDSNTTGLEFDVWEKERTESIVNKVEVQAVNSNGDKVTATATNQDMIDKYGVKYEKIKVGYVESVSEAETIAEERLNPGKDSNGNDITSPPEGGVVNLPTLNFREGIENDSVNVVDSELGIDDSFTVTKHKLFYPSGRSELHLDFEDEKTEERAEKDNYLGDERARLLPSSQEDVGNQNVDADTEDVDESYDDFGNDNHPHGNPDTTSQVGQIATGSVESASENIFTLTDDQSNVVTIGQNATIYGGNQAYLSFKLETDSGYGNEFIVQLSYLSATGDTIIKSYVTKTNNGGNIEDEVVDNFPSGAGLEFTIVNKSGGAVNVTEQNVFFVGESPHSHDVPIGDTDFNTTGGQNETNPSDSNAGDTTSLSAEGSTDAKNINVATEDKTNR